MVEVDSIIFDLDGTLVDSQEDIVDSVNYTLKQVGLRERPFDEVVSFIGAGVENLIKRSLGNKNGQMFDKAISIFSRYYKEHVVEKSKLYPHAEEVLEFFKNKSLFVVSNKRSSMAHLTLKGLGIDKYFKDVIGGDDESCLKPSTCMLDKALGEIDDRRKAVMVGDMDLDILSGKRAGILTCGVTYGIGKKEDIVKAGPDYIIDDLGELKKIIKR